MPVLSSEIVPVPFWQFNGHLQTILPNYNRKVEGIHYQRERVSTWDDDFLDLDWSKVESKTLVIVSHGLAGSSNEGYMKSLVKISNENGWDALAWNYRGCSGEPNKKLSSFHGGKSDDLEWVIQHAVSHHGYEDIYLIGVSMGGNITLKLLGEWCEEAIPQVKAAVAISTPIDMFNTSVHLIKGWNKIYSDRYLKQYKEMLVKKCDLFEQEELDFQYVYDSENLHVFADRFTARCFGFKDVEDYLKSQSSINYLKNIRIPALLINADNDPFLTETCYPYEVAEDSSYFYLLKTINGGHVGFAEKNSETYSWVDKRTITFFKDL